MNLIIDIGNTRVKVAIFRNSEIIFNEIFEDISIDILSQFTQKYDELNNVILSSVRDYPAEIKDYLEQTFDCFIELDSKTQIPIINKYKSPETLGKDRIAAAVGATTLFPNTNILVVDAGTAITYEIINAKNEYLGGNISPGLTTRFRALSQFTGKLPLISIEDDFQQIGTTTESAIRAGVQLGILFEVEQYINYFNNLYQKLQIIITGGDAKFFDKKLKNSIFVHLNLTLIGLNRILEYNVKET
ncbi:type III pantothenate kinase [Sunxiuqinia sp. A32]|uniref:type III pantothenate kinase n=1 Tax=Sunxiuqinia sp. A32 TaxID=3461496 RepID=UPI004046396E